MVLQEKIDMVKEIFDRHQYQFRSAILSDLMEYASTEGRFKRNRFREDSSIISLNLAVQGYSTRRIARFSGITHQGVTRRLNSAIAIIEALYGPFDSLKTRTPMIQLIYKTHFDAAHFLPLHPGKCSLLHGHRWDVDVTIEGRTDKATGILIDFSTIKEIMIANLPDHSLLNDTIKNPTAERIAKFLFDRISKELLKIDEKLKMKSITVWETPTTGATYVGKT